MAAHTRPAASQVDNRGVNHSETEVCILLGQFGHAVDVCTGERDQADLAAADGPQKRGLGTDAVLALLSIGAACDSGNWPTRWCSSSRKMLIRTRIRTVGQQWDRPAADEYRRPRVVMPRTVLLPPCWIPARCAPSAQVTAVRAMFRFNV
jgi:hypothetical protein